MSAPLQLVVPARKAASAQSLDAALVCAVVELAAAVSGNASAERRSGF
ncbi:MAG TPA: hypothetical protein VN037_12590 [Verrucomicrobiae bacterium]|nr:hypothetical protein [Verrucomicrobiae bacterium]